MEARLPGARALVVIERTSIIDGEEKNSTAFYVTSHTPTPDGARSFGELARGHWGGCESRNHWVRDACMREDKTRCKNYRINCNLSALRVCLVALKADLYPQSSWPELQERCQRYPQIPYRALVKHRAK